MSWYLMHRGWMTSEVFKPVPFTEREAWVWLIENAAYEATVVNVNRCPVKIQRGTLTYSLRYLCKAWGWASPDSVRRYLRRLERWGMLSYESVTQQTLLTLCNYDRYQSPSARSGTLIGQQAHLHGDTAGTVTATNKNEVKEKKEIKQSLLDEVDVPAWMPLDAITAFIEFRNAIKKPIKTVRALELIIEKLTALDREGHPPDKVLNQSIMNGWQGLFPLSPDRSAIAHAKTHSEKKTYAQRMMEASVQAVIDMQNSEGTSP